MALFDGPTGAEYSPTMTPAFDLAAKRHYSDGMVLHGSGRYDNADHLAGLAAECALKALLAAVPGVTVNAKGILVDSASTRYNLHVEDLWGSVQAVPAAAPSQAQAALAALPTTNPFHGWSISDRYAAPHISQAVASAHLAAALVLLETWSAATGVPL